MNTSTGHKRSKRAAHRKNAALRRLGFPLSLLSMTLAASASAKPAVTLERILPDTVYVESRGSTQRLNFDIELRNHTGEPIQLTYLEMRAFAPDGLFLTRAQIGSNGLPGPIESLPERTIPPRNTLYLFNPFPDLPTESPIGRVLLRVLHTAGETSLEIEPSLPPRPYLERSPLRKPAYVFSGSDLNSHHRRVALNSEPARAIGLERITQRYAIDLTRVDVNTGNLAALPLQANENWFAYGMTVVAPANGRIVRLRSDMPDNVTNEDGRITKPDNYEAFGSDASLGNYIVMDIGGAYLLMSHFKHDSLSVEQGERVTAGDVLGTLGFSGDTAYPHLHVQLQDTPDPLSAHPLPIFFDCIRIGTESVARDRPNSAVDSGLFMQSCSDELQDAETP